MQTQRSETVLKAALHVAAIVAMAVAMLGVMASLASAWLPVRAWANTGSSLQSAPLVAASADYYAVLHEDGELVFQAQPSDELGVTNFAGSCAPYTSGKAPWLAKAQLIESVRFDESFAGVQPESLAFWFIGCENLKAIDLRNLDASASTSMRSMFSGCSSLTTIENLASFDTSSSTYFGSMFRNCSSLTALDVSHFDATHVGVLCFMFAGCTKLETLNMAGEGWRTSSLYLMVHVWENCSSLKSLDLSYLNTAGVHSMAKDFNGCSSLERLDLSGADTSNVGSLEGMFDGCGKLASVKLGSKFTFNGLGDARQCSLPEGDWKSAATGAVYASADVPNNTADTYTREVTGGDPTGQGTGSGSGEGEGSGASSGAVGEYDLPSLACNLGMFNHFVDGSQKLSVTEDKVTLSFTTDGSIDMVRNISKVAIGPSSKLVNTADMKQGETKWANSLVGEPLVFEGTLVSDEGEDEQYAFELEFDKAQFEQMLAQDGGVYLTLYHIGKNAWHKGNGDLLLTLGKNGAYGTGGTSGGTGPDTPGEGGEGAEGEIVDPSAIEDGTYTVELTVMPSMIKLAGHEGQAAEPRIVVSGEDAWLVASYRSSEGSAWRYGQMTWGSQGDAVAAGKNGVGGAPLFKAGKSAADGMSDATIDAMTFALPMRKADLVGMLISGKAQPFTVRYVIGYSAEHDGDWWLPKSGQSTLALANLRVASEPASVPADYAAVLDALASVPSDLGIYTDESAGALVDALAVVNGSPKTVAEQGTVDGLAKAIVDAVGGLETKEAAAAREAAERAAAEKAAAERIEAAEKAAAESAAAARTAADQATAAEKRAAAAEAKAAAAEKKAADAERKAAQAEEKAKAAEQKAAAAEKDAKTAAAAKTAAEKAAASNAATASAAQKAADAAQKAAKAAKKKAAAAEKKVAAAQKKVAAAQKQAKAAKKAAAAASEAVAKTITGITVNKKIVNPKAIKTAIAAAGGKVQYVKTITLGKKVRKITRGAFKNTKATVLVVKTKKLNKKSVAGSLKGSKVKTVQVKVGNVKANKQFAKKYKKLFTKKTAGKTANVTR